MTRTTTLGKSPKPLSILVHPTIFSWEEWRALSTQGHEITPMNEPNDAGSDEYDLIVGPTCWRMDTQHRKYLAVAIAAARKVRYPKVDQPPLTKAVRDTIIADTLEDTE